MKRKRKWKRGDVLIESLYDLEICLRIYRGV